MRTGVDMVDVSRFLRVDPADNARLMSRLLREEETEAFPSPRDRAMVFALKEAVSKALGTGIASGVRWHDIQVLRNGSGHRVILHGAAETLARGDRLHVSAHCTPTLAVAVAVLDDGQSSYGLEFSP